MIDGYLIPATKEQYYAVAASVRKERGEKCLTLGATYSAPEGSCFSNRAVMMTTWELDDYPLVRVEQSNPGERLTYDERDVWAYWINADHAWRTTPTARSQERATPYAHKRVYPYPNGDELK